MELKILGSSSSGNCCILTDKGGNSLIIELGVNFKEIQKSFGFDLSKVSGAIVTHEHGDHAKSLLKAMDSGIEVFATKGTFEGTKLGSSDHHNATIINYFVNQKIGSYTVVPFDIDHDVNEPCGFIIYHPEMGYTLFLTDTTYLKYNFENIKFSNLLIEANYCEEILNDIENKKFLRDRIVFNHMSIQSLETTLLRMDLSSVKNIVLIHLSDRNSEDDYFKDKISRSTGRPVSIAKKNMIMDISNF